ncbi:MAG: ABC transporter permease [Dehalococcoidia bacterium]
MAANSVTAGAGEFVGRPLPGRVSRVAHFARRKPVAAFGGLVVILLVVLALIAPMVAPYAYDEPRVLDRLQGPSAAHWFGTDHQGRDVLSRIIYGSQVTVILCFGAVGLSTLVSTAIGTISGYFGGLTDTVIQRFVDIWQAFPGLIFIIFMVSVFGSDRWSLIVVLGLLFGVGSSRVVRSATLAVRRLAYVEAAQALGASHPRILMSHILPNVVPVVIVTASVQVGAVILAESSLSYLGFGTPPPFPTWGRMLQESQQFMQRNPTLAVFPGAAIALVVYSVNMFGDGLRDALDPRLRGTR